MFNFDRKVAAEICFGDLSLNPQRWFEEEVNDLALRFPGLDEMPIAAILPLAQLSANGPLTEADLVRTTGLELSVVDNCLGALCEQKLASECNAGFEATDKGKDVFRAIGTKLVIRRRFEMKGRYEHLTGLYKHLNAKWYKD